MSVNGVPVSFFYAKGKVEVLPKTLDGKPSSSDVDFLASVRVASLEPEKFTYAKGYLASAARGERTQRFAVQAETLAERRQNLKSAEPKSKVAHTGKVAGRLVSDEDFTYSYPSKTSVRLANAAKDAEVAYAYDAVGRLSSVLDENGNEIKFGWDRFGLSSRLTAANQLTDVKRDANGLVASVSASETGRVDRVVRREYDDFDRVAKVEYAKDEAETFAYDKWGRVAEHTRGKLKETYSYDHFGRLVEKAEGKTSYACEYNAYGQRTSRRVTDSAGVTTEERRVYDRYGRLSEIRSFGASVKYTYDTKGRVSRQTVDGTPIDYVYTKYGQLAAKHLGGKQNPEASVEYEYAKSGQIVARTANGARQTYEYDGRGQLLAAKNADGSDAERYAYDKAGSMVRKTVGGKTTTFTFDGANQLVSSTTDGVTTKYAYDAAGRRVKEGTKAYRYGYLDKVLSVTDGKSEYTYDYHVDGQLARANYDGNGRAGCPQPAASESFHWDGLALIRRGGERFINEPHVGGGNPVVSSKGTSYFNDMLGTTLGAKGKYRKYSAAALTAFGEDLSVHSPTPTHNSNFYTGKPYVEGLGHAFLFRNYRAGLAKWQTADPLGYPDGWNALAYCGNGVISTVDLCGGLKEKIVRFDTDLLFSSNFVTIPWYNDEWDAFGLARSEAEKAGKSIKDWVKGKLEEYKKKKIDDFDTNSLMVAFLQYFSDNQGGGYNATPPSDDLDPWKSILEENESAGWTLEWGPVHAGVTLIRDDDIVNAGIFALVITGCMHHWQAKFVKE